MTHVELQHITIGYGHRVLLEDVSAAIGGGRLVALLGRNGTGKSTLLRAVAGLEAPLSGGIRLCGRLLSATPAHELAQVVSFVTTEKVRIANLASRDVVGLGRAPYTDWLGRLRPGDRAVVDRALNLVGMGGFADKPMDRLSDGEAQRVMIARALAQDTPVILLDEPTAFLDMPNRYELCTLLHRLALCDAVALIDPPRLHLLPTDEMIRSGHIERLFDNGTVAFDASTRTVTVRR